jgi:hypothetical protein
MLAEVAKYGAVSNFGNNSDNVIHASQLIINAQTFDPKDPKKRPVGWFEIRRQRVLVKEQVDRLNGVDEQTIIDMRAQREKDVSCVRLCVFMALVVIVGHFTHIRTNHFIILLSHCLLQEEALMVAEAVKNKRVLSVRYEGNLDEEMNESNMVFNVGNFNPADPNKRPRGWFEIRQKRVALKEQADRNNGVSEETIAEMRHQRELEVG